MLYKTDSAKFLRILIGLCFAFILALTVSGCSSSNSTNSNDTAVESTKGKSSEAPESKESSEPEYYLKNGSSGFDAELVSVADDGIIIEMTGILDEGNYGSVAITKFVNGDVEYPVTYDSEQDAYTVEGITYTYNDEPDTFDLLQFQGTDSTTLFVSCDDITNAADYEGFKIVFDENDQDQGLSGNVKQYSYGDLEMVVKAR